MSLASRLSKVIQCLQDNGLSTSTFMSGILESSHVEHQDAKLLLRSNASQMCMLLNANEDSHSSVLSWAIALMDLGEFGGDSIGLMGPSNDDSDDESEEAFERCPKKCQRRAAERNEVLLVIKAVVAISICLQSLNEKCNYLQGWMGFFMKSTCVPEKVVEVLAHAGLSISLSSIHNAVTSVSKEISSKIRSEVRALQAAFTYNNFNIAFKTSQPTLENQSSFVSATSATVVPLFGINESNAVALKCSAQLWASDHRNPLPSVTPLMNEMRAMMDLHKKDTYSHQINPTKPTILINQHQKFKHFLKDLGKPETIKRIPVHTTYQIPCQDLFRQGGIGDKRDSSFNADHDVDMTKHIIIVHGDLLTKERLDTVCNSRRIEHTPKNRLQYVIFLPGLFHYKMACILRPDEMGKIVSKPGFRRTPQMSPLRSLSIASTRKSIDMPE
ncbi:hypothetical protein BDR03DRAFT_935057 [Suillus americanus]|nr:hypothetical protein BDR03DRAFT_935057 [Suillus americanus]